MLHRSEGKLQVVNQVDKSLSGLLKDKLKAVADLPETEGEVAEVIFSQTHNEKAHQIHLTAVPTLLGEHLHLHFYGDEDESTITDLGYTPEQTEALRSLLTGRPGLFLMVGAADPTSSRHRLALANELGRSGRLVISLEHRLQYRSELLVQLEVSPENEKKDEEEGETEGEQKTESGSATLWQTALGMSPEVLFTDEVRGAQEASGLLEAVYAGSVVVAQVRAPGGVEALTQLIDFGLNRDGLARLLLGLVERVSLRRLCPHCRKKRQVSAQEAEFLEISTDTQIWQQVGCESCGDGFLGRRMLYGLWIMDDELSKIIRLPELNEEMFRAWKQGNPFFLQHAAKTAVLAGEVIFEDAKPFLGTASTSSHARSSPTII